MTKIISGIVIKGNQKGRQLGFKTANIKPDSKDLEAGVYKINIVIDDVIYPGVGTYIDGLKVFEAHIFDYEKDIYGENIEVYLLKKIRDNKKYNCDFDLINQIKEDIETVKNIEIRVLTFGTFDFVHPGHENYLFNAKKYGGYLITVVGRDENVEKIKGEKPLNNHFIRKEDVEGLKISDLVIIGNQSDPYLCLEECSADIVCLGYDQHGFADDLQKYIDKNNLKVNIARLAPYHEDVYKSSKLKK